MVITYDLSDFPFLDLDFEHVLLTSGYEYFIGTLRGKAKTPKIRHVFMTNVWSVDGPGASR